MREVAERIRAKGAVLTAAERRIAEVLLSSPQVVGFGTVADLAKAADAGTATAVRLATKLGYDGYSELRDAVQRDLLGRLRPAAERIREPAGSGLVEQHRAIEVDNVERTLAAVDEDQLLALIDRLADLDRNVLVLSGDASDGVARQFAGELGALRDGVECLRGNAVALRRQLAQAAETVTVLTVDLRRYDRWVLDLLAEVRHRGMWNAAFTDGVLSPLAIDADATFVLTNESVGPFDSHVGTLALLDLVIAEVAERLRDTAAERLERAERAWTDSGQLTSD